MRVALTPKDFEKCFQDLSIVFPDVKFDLELRICRLFGGLVSPEITIWKHAPSIRVALPFSPREESPEDRRQVELAAVIDEMAADYGLRVNSFLSMNYQSSLYFLKPDYERYRID